jgi:cytochrome d ubiquinol oxidase subunit II
MTKILTLSNVCALAVLAALTAYVVLAGADFGGGVWDFLAAGPRKNQQRELIARAIGPIWEANHVWLILVVVLLFTCFPPVFALLMTYLHVPLVLMLIGIVLRGSAFAFRAYDVKPSPTAKFWERVFASASVITPLILGMCVGAIASGAVGAISGRNGVYATFFASWLSPFPIACGVLALTAFTFLAAVYLTVDARDPALREDFRTRALYAAGAVFVVALGTLAVAHFFAPRLRQSLMGNVWTAPLLFATGAAAALTIVALWARRWRIARMAAPAEVALILWGWAGTQYPALVPGRFTIAQAAAPEITLRLTLWALAIGGTVLFPSLWYLFRIFKSRSAAPA